MQIINGKKYYSIKEIINKINEECGLNLKKNNSTYQRFYRNSFPFVMAKTDEADYQYRLYDEDVVFEIIDFYNRKKKIKEYLKEATEMRVKNTLFIRKYAKAGKLPKK